MSETHFSSIIKNWKNIKLYIIMEKKLTNKERTILNHATPVARKWAYYKFQNDIAFEEFQNNFEILVCAEQKLYKTWRQQACNIIAFKRVYGDALKIYYKLCFESKFCPIQKLLPQAQKLYAKTKDKEVAFVLSVMQGYQNKIKEFNKTAYQMLVEGNNISLILDWAEEADRQEAIKRERMLYLEQTIKHLKKLQELRVVLSREQIKTLLKPTACSQELLDEIAILIDDAHDKLPKGERAKSYEDICSFIAEVAPIVGYIPVSLVQFIFKNDWLSKTSYNLLLAIQDTIQKLSMTPVITMPLNKLYQPLAQKIEQDQNTRISYSDYYVLKLAIAYKIASPFIVEFVNNTKKPQVK